MVKLIIVRHGQSEWNTSNKFTGWVDIRLGDLGKQEAAHAGELLVQSQIRPDIVYTSKLTRAIQTANIVLDKADLLYLDVKRSWRLNERHYGALQGRSKEAVLDEVGPAQLNLWRRSFDIPPPPVTPDSPYSQLHDPRYAPASPPPAQIPRSESLKNLIDRLLPYWHAQIAPDLLAGKNVVIFTHGTVMRALIKTIEGVSDKDICAINVPTAVPLVYDLDEHNDLELLKPGEYLDPDAAAAGIARSARIK